MNRSSEAKKIKVQCANYLLVGKQASHTFSVGDKVPKKTRQSKLNNLFTHTGETESASCSCWRIEEQITLPNSMTVPFVGLRWDSSRSCVMSTFHFLFLGCL